MKTLRSENVDSAERFVWLSGRLLDRLRFAFLFRGGGRERVLAALRPYQNADGGFGEALEPDFRGPVSQPVTTHGGLQVLDEIDAFDDPMVGRACEFLAKVTAAEGGVPTLLPDVPHFPHAPWWNPAPGEPRASLLPTAGIAGLLHKHAVDHPWLAGATSFCWDAIEALGRAPMSLGLPYLVRYALVFLDHVPDRARARDAAAKLGRRALEIGAVAMDPMASGEVHFPLDFAPEPETLARNWFDEDTIGRHLDALVEAQQEDGGWPINWPVWTPATGLEWRAGQTVQRLETLKAYGRFPAS
jgi:hypothetical protein